MESVQVEYFKTPYGEPVLGAFENELFEIPFGKTISYLELSKNLENEKAIRAVASSNHKNAISILVPCHREIGADGNFIGYAA